ncbi:MAG: LLM class flavin-dependent oxidoreductase [SAR202 cluster bacterium]|nr:LLM class flavin-dependent oxidoreductase [SAR202 cluster bacterium]
MTTKPLKPRIGALLPTRGLLMEGPQPHNADLILNMARAIESAGLDSLWVGDSLTAKPRLEPLSTLAALAGITRRVRLGTAVMLAALRHPVLLAQTAATVDLISGGRLVLAVGAGGAFNAEQQKEWQTAGVKASQRGRRLEEAMEVVGRLGTEARVTFHGKHFHLQDVAMSPRPVQPGGIPLLFACHLRAERPAQFDRAARIGHGYITISENPQGFEEIGRRVKERAAVHGKNFDTMQKVIYMTVNLNPDRRQALDESDRYLKLYYGVNIWRDLWGPWGHPDLTTQRIREFLQAGATTVIVRFAAFDQERHLDSFLQNVWPNFRK